jgi:flagellar assembly protein FliH
MSKVIPKETSDEYQRWNLPAVEDDSVAGQHSKAGQVGGLMTAEQIESIQAQAYKEAYAAGFTKGQNEGKAAGLNEIENKAKLLTNILASFCLPFEKLDESVEQQIVSLAMSIAKQLVRRELKADPAQVLGVVHEALSVLPVASQNVKICLHPDDTQVVKEALSETDTDNNWSLVQDPNVERGDCRILTDVSQIEANLEQRLTAVVAKLLGGERERDSSAT